MERFRFHFSNFKNGRLYHRFRILPRKCNDAVPGSKLRRVVRTITLEAFQHLGHSAKKSWQRGVRSTLLKHSNQENQIHVFDQKMKINQTKSKPQASPACLSIDNQAMQKMKNQRHMPAPSPSDNSVVTTT